MTEQTAQERLREVGQLTITPPARLVTQQS